MDSIPAPGSRTRWTRATRYYEAGVGRDLFDTSILTVWYGRIGTPMGRTRSYPYATDAAAADAYHRAAARRAARGYRPS